jgi:hypothetical protein
MIWQDRVAEWQGFEVRESNCAPLNSSPPSVVFRPQKIMATINNTPTMFYFLFEFIMLKLKVMFCLPNATFLNAEVLTKPPHVFSWLM